MTKKSTAKKLKHIVASAEAHFGKTVDKVTAPGGEGRSSYRLFIGERSVIATYRPNFRRTHLEAFVLTRLNQHCDDIPECLGVVGEVMFQSDVGGRRLNQEIARHGQRRKEELAHEAVASIFRIQNAARKTDLHEKLPHLGVNTQWTDNFVEAADALEPYSSGHSAKVDLVALKEKIASPGRQFVKWDCRSGNAALADDDKLRWFDFEYSGLRHGAEDLAWLIGDEAWPLSPQTMLEIVEGCFDPDTGHKLEDYIEYLSLYLTLHAVQRFKLIIKEVARRGWLSKTRVRKYDDAGLHPEFAAHICRVGQFFAERSPLTAPIGQDFAQAEQVFLQMLHSAQRKSA